MVHRRAGRAPIANINVTPLVDVMLVLLIIFMVTSPMLSQGVDVDLPETATTPVKQAKEPLTVTIDRAGQVHIEDHVVALDRLGAKVEAIFRARESRKREVLLRADRKVPYGVVAQVMASLQEAGVDHLGMVTRPAEAE